MKYKFSPIRNKEYLLKAVRYLHVECNKLCKQTFGHYLPVSGNIGIFCHYQDEYEFLTNLRKELTNEDKHWNEKYYFLKEPITIPGSNEIPGAIYTYLYVRHPDDTKPQVGDIDFVMDGDSFLNFKNLSTKGYAAGSTEVFYRPDLDMLRLSKNDSDVLPYITTTSMEEKKR
jgi:hypothetical protein